MNEVAPKPVNQCFKTIYKIQGTVIRNDTSKLFWKKYYYFISPTPVDKLSPVNKLISPVRMITYVKIFIEFLSLKDTNSCSFVWRQVDGEPNCQSGCMLTYCASLRSLKVYRLLIIKYPQVITVNFIH